MLRLGFQPLFVAALVSLALSNAGCSSVFGDRATQDAPPQPTRPCELPYQEKAGDLPPQGDLSVPLQGPDWIQLERQDAGAYNGLFPKFNANIDFAGSHCIAKPAAISPPSK